MAHMTYDRNWMKLVQDVKKSHQEYQIYEMHLNQALLRVAPEMLTTRR